MADSYQLMARIKIKIAQEQVAPGLFLFKVR
jgi:hypothetical protein